MAQDNGYVFVEVQEDGTKTICIECWFEAQLVHGMSFATRPKPDREVMWVHCQMHRSRMGHTTTNRGLQITKVDPPVDLFVNHIRSLFECDFMSLVSSFTLGSTKEAKNVKIVQSCNGLLLCTGLGRPVFDYVYNPSTNQFKRIPHPDCSLDNSPYYRSDGLRMTFDPTKSLHYKLVDVGRTSYDIDI
ncbi:hypothetical protein Tco_0549320 [Tanacetum coccineum]